jgi:hypothetical protein
VGSSTEKLFWSQYLVPEHPVPFSDQLKQLTELGRALDARKVERDGRTLYNVKWLGSDGKVRVITVDATSGRIEQIR